MKKSIALVSVLLCAAILFSSCMNVKITFPEQETINPNGNNTYNPVPEVQTTAPYVPEVVITLPDAAETTAAENTTQSEVTTAAVQTKQPLEMSKEELLEYFNNNLNGVKEKQAGFKRAKLTTVSDIKLSNQAANTLVGFVKGALLSEEVEEKTATKGSPCADIMSPDGERYTSQLSYEDIESIEVNVEGTNYAVTVKLPAATNPAKETGAYGKIFNFITVDDVVSTYAPKVGATVDRNNIQVKYSGCYAKAVFDTEGKVVSYSTYVTCVISLLDASVKKVVTINTDVDITLVSTTDYTQFDY